MRTKMSSCSRSTRPPAVPLNRASKRTASRSGRTRSRCGRDQKTVRVDVAEFFAGNGVTYDGVDDVEYRILLGEDTYDIDGDLLTRMPTHAGVEIEQKVETTSGSANSNSQDEVVGLYISTIVGLKDPQAGGSEDGGDYANRSISTFPSITVSP